MAGKRRLTRREFLRDAAVGAAAVGAASVVGSCAPAATPTPAAPTPTTPAAPTPTAVATPTPGAVRGGRFTFAQDVECIGGLDCYLTMVTQATFCTEGMFDTLIRPNPKGELVPSLAESWEYEDPNTLVLKLRKGVKFHHGKELVADDVKATFERARNPKSGAVWGATFGAISKIETPEKYTVRITTTDLFAPLISMLAAHGISPIFPADVLEAQGDMKTNPVGTGPFKFKDYLADHLLLERNPDYWESGLPYVDEVNFVFISDETARTVALGEASVDGAWIKDPVMIKELEPDVQAGKLIMFPCAGTLPRYIWINHQAEPLNNVDVRRALSMAINREEFLQTYALGLGAIGGMIPLMNAPFAYPEPEKLPYIQYDPEKAKELLAKAGYPNGFPIKLQTGAGLMDYRSMSEAIQGYWKDIGLDAVIDEVDPSDYEANLPKRNYETSIMGWDQVPDPDMYIFDNFHSTSPMNRAGTLGASKDPELDELAEKGRKELDLEARIKIYHTIEERIADQTHLIILHHRMYPVDVIQPYVKNYIQQWANMFGTRRESLANLWLQK